ncbi:MAG TPA: hypothetical protein VKV79_03860 [Terriglobia bacterium]|nr:hypothetical protein [Terriglobia bacterium]
MNARHRSKFVLLFVAVMVITAPVAVSQMGRGMGTGIGRGRGNHMYNPATEVTIKGTVEKVQTISSRGGWNGTHLMLKTKSGPLEVHLGPSSYVRGKKFEFAKGDKVEVTGSKVKYQDQEVVIAREVKKGGKVLTLRNAQGIPEWAGGRRMMMMMMNPQQYEGVQPSGRNA